MSGRDSWAPLPLRLILGVSLVLQGYPKLFTAAGHDNIVQMLEALHVPLAGLVGWAVGSIEFFGGVAIFLGAFTRLASALNIFSTGGHAFLALIEGGFPPPLPGQQPLPGFELSSVMLACLAALLLGGAGRWAIDRRREARELARMHPLTILAKIKPGEEPSLRQILADIQDYPERNPYVQFPEDRISHFARFLIIVDAENGPRLIFASVYNGELDAYLEELSRISPGLDDIWGRCEGYAGRHDFIRFAREQSQRNRAIYFGFPTESLQTIRTKVALRSQIEAFLSLPQVARYMLVPGVVPFLDMLSRVATPPSLLTRLWGWISSVWNAIRMTIHNALLHLGMWLAQQYGAFGMAKVFPLSSPICSDPEEAALYIKHLNALQAEEGRFVQTPFTVYAEVRRHRLLRLRIALFFSAPLIRYGWPPGDFAGVFTLHNFRWLLLDGGKRLMFMSDFDGSAQNYLGDFVDKLIWGLDTFYNNCVGYPPGGMRQIEMFVQWIRSHQLLQQVYHSAYPNVTVMNLITDRAITSMMEAHFSREQAERWLRLL
jgi:uncharacterized membrane protein YphA (DoxX/SURF4 family)